MDSLNRGHTGTDVCSGLVYLVYNRFVLMRNDSLSSADVDKYIVDSLCRCYTCLMICRNDSYLSSESILSINNLVTVMERSEPPVRTLEAALPPSHPVTELVPWWSRRQEHFYKLEKEKPLDHLSTCQSDYRTSLFQRYGSPPSRVAAKLNLPVRIIAKSY